MALDKFVIYTLKGKEIISRGKRVEQTIVDPLDNKEKEGHIMEFHIDLSNDFEKMLLLKNEEDIEKDDTALFYQMRELLIEQSDDKYYKMFSKPHFDAHCLTDKIFVVDFGKLFLRLEEDIYFGYHKIEKEYEQKVTELKADPSYYTMIPDDEYIQRQEEYLFHSLYMSNEELYSEEISPPTLTGELIFNPNEEYTAQLHDIQKSADEKKHEHNINFKNDSITDTETIRLMFQNGIQIKFTADGEEKTFVPFDKSQSMARNSKITFIDESLQADINRRLLLGHDKIGPFSPSKFYAYKGLYLSSGQRITDKELVLNEETVIVIPNGPTFHDESIEYKTNTTDSNDIKIISGNGIDIDTMFDGEGIISMDYARILNKKILGKLFPDSSSLDITSFQIRMPFIKGMVHSIDIKGFLDEFCGKEQEEIWIKDCFGIKRDLRKAKLILTQSMYKTFVKGGYDWFTSSKFQMIDQHINDHMKAYFKRFEEFNHALYISGTNRPYKNRSLTTLNYQFLNTLDLTEENLISLLDEHLEYANNPIDYLKRVANIESTDEVDSDCSLPNYTSDISKTNDNQNDYENLDDEDNEPDTTETSESEDDEPDTNENSEPDDNGTDAPTASSTSRILTGHIPNWQAALFKNNDFIHNSYVKAKVNAIRDSLRKDAAFGRLLVDGEVRYLSRDILCFLKYILELVDGNKIDDNLKDKLKELENEVEALVDSFYMPSANIALKEKQHYPIFRSPHLSRNEQCVLKASSVAKDSLRHKYLGHLEGVIMVAYNSFVPDALGGADFDGDIVKIFDSDTLRDAVLRGVYGMNDEYSTDENYKRTLPIVRISAFPSNADDYYDATKFNSSVYYDVIFHTFSNSVGMISNLAIKLGRKQYNKASSDNTENNQKTNLRTYNCEDCTILTGLEIDACKTGKHPSLKSIFEEAKKIQNPYIMDFLPSIKRLRYISLKNFIKNDKGEYEYKDKYNKKVKVAKADKNGTDNLQLLAYYYMEKCMELNNTSNNVTTVNGKKCTLFEFETDSNWEETIRTEDVTYLKNLYKAYKYANRIVQEYKKQYSPNDSSRMKRYIFRIWSNQDGDNKLSSLEYGKLYRNILIYIGDALNLMSDTSFTNILEDFTNSDWPYLYTNDDKLKFLSDFLQIPEDKLDKRLTERLCNFDCRGYNLLYLFIREADRIANYINLKDVSQKQIETGNFLFDDKKILAHDEIKNFLAYMMNEINESHADAKTSLSQYLNKKLLEYFTGNNSGNENDEYLFKLMYYISKSDSSLNNFFWDYYSTEEIKKRIYTTKEDKNA